MKKVTLLIIFFIYITLNYKNILGERIYSQPGANHTKPFSEKSGGNEYLKGVTFISVVKNDCLNNLDYINCNVPQDVKAMVKKKPSQSSFQALNSKKVATPILATIKKQQKDKNSTQTKSLEIKLLKSIGEAKPEKIDKRTVTLENFLKKHNSPLVPYAKDFVYWADYYEVDWRLVPAIAGVESTFGKRIPKNSHNAYGWNNGNYKFSSWPASIEHVTKTLREKYINKNADTVDRIAKRYAPPSTTWAGNVKFFMNKIDNSPIASNF